MKISSTPCLVLAYYLKEYNEQKEKAVPADIIEVNNVDDENILFLKEGKYILLIKDGTSKIEKFEIKVD